MLRWATIFFALPLLVALMGVGDFAAFATNIAVGLFVLSLVAFLLTFIIHPSQESEENHESRYEGELSN